MTTTWLLQFRLPVPNEKILGNDKMH